MTPSNTPSTSGMRWIHRLILWRFGISVEEVLNNGEAPDSGRSAPGIAAELNRFSKRMESEAFGQEGGRVDYAKIRGGETYASYRDLANGLRSFDPASLSTSEERLAFWINLYNALIVDAVIQFDVEETVQEVDGFFWRAAYNVGGYRFNAFDIEYGVLRANGPHPGIPGPHFGRRDPRRRYSLETLDARVHFAVVCAADSCPAIAAFDPERIDEQLDAAAAAFINGGGVEVDRSECVVRLSKIFQWYAPDFGGGMLGLGDRRPLLDYVHRYMSDPADRKAAQSEDVRVRFQDYSWTLNGLTPAGT